MNEQKKEEIHDTFKKKIMKESSAYVNVALYVFVCTLAAISRHEVA